MFFPISNAHISPIYLVVIGFVIGILGGFFGVGGSFIAGPALRAVGLDWNFAVGTDLAHIVGKSVVAVRQHRAFGNVDLKLGLIMAFGTIGGAEVGAQLIQMLKRAGNLNLVVSIVSIAVYVSISTFMIWESRKTLSQTRLPTGTVKGATAKHDPSAFKHVTSRIQRLKIFPMITLPASGVTISLWIILLVAFVGGLFPSRRRHRFVRDYYFSQLWNLQPCDQRQRRHSDCARYAHRGCHRRADRCHFNAIFRRAEDPACLRPLAINRRCHCHLHADDRPQIVIG